MSPFAVAAAALSFITPAPPPPLILERPEGRIAYSDTGGSGQVVVCVPGLGDGRRTWRFLTPALVARGYRVVSMDLRGLGDSSTSFSDYSAAAVGADVIALIEGLGSGPAVVVGNSMAGAAAVWAAAERPDLIRALALVDPFVRDIPQGVFQTLLLKMALLRPWGPSVWGSYYKSLYGTHKPDDLEAYTAALVRSVRERGRMEATRAMVWSSKSPCERRLGEVKAPTLVIMGSADPDFADPQAEARHVATALHGQVLMVSGAGHYPHSEQPELIAQGIAQLAGGTP
jgi:pimeloyl-ACP methyl ester carboxylesterase